jgi:phage baseplate assembly protein W
MRNGFTPSFPFRKDDEESDFILVDTTRDLVRQNLKNLILTNPGERMMIPEFGVGIKRFLFENKTPTTTSIINGIISSQVKKYMPFVVIDKINFISPEDNPNYLGIMINYVIVPTSTKDSLILSFDLARQSLIR